MNRGGRALGVIVVVVVLAAAAGSVVVAGTSTRSYFPRHWDDQVAPIAAEVARLRGLDFRHPVAIRYLDPKEFEKQLGADGGVSVATRAEVLREESVFRALGFIGGKVDLLTAIDTSQTSGTLAYYDPDQQNIIVRGTTLDVAHRVTLAHELTHVLQDQHFDLPKLQQQADRSTSGDPSALKALVEGDAVRIQDAYLKQLSAAENREYNRENDAVDARVKKETASVPEIVDLLSSAPYAFGPSTVRVIESSGGNRAVDEALTGPPPSSAVFTATGDVTPAVAVAAPLPSSDGVLVGHSESFGPFEMFLTLSMRLDPERALAAADAVGGGTAITFQSRGVSCYRVAVDPMFPHSRQFLLRAVGDWARGRARTTLDPAGDLVGFTACDPGRRAPVPAEARIRHAIEVLSIRNELTVEVAKEHLSGDVARCIARVFVASPGAEQLILAIGNGTPTAAQAARLQDVAVSSAQACRADPASGQA